MSKHPMEDSKYSQMEVEAFININSKGKQVKTDLAESLKKLMQDSELKKNSKINADNDAIKASATRITMMLSKDDTSFWHDKIIFGDEIERKKPISLVAFSKAIRPVVQLRLQQLQVDGAIGFNATKIQFATEYLYIKDKNEEMLYAMV